MVRPVLNRSGDVVGQFDGEKFFMNDGTTWVISEGNVYQEGDVGGVSFLGHFSNDTITSMMGRVLLTVGAPYEED